LLVGWLAEQSLVSCGLDSTIWPDHRSLRLLSMIAYSIAYLAGGVPILRLSWQSALNRQISIDTLMLLSAVASGVIGDFVDGAMLLFLFSFSHGLETFILGRTRNAIR
jgi:Cd2+/Zn2+-exporting ATPase